MATAPYAKERGQEILSLAQAAEFCCLSDTTIRKLVGAKLLPMTQAAPWAPWEIQRADLEVKPVRGIVERLRKKLETLSCGGSFWKINHHCFNEINNLIRGVL